jgi:hypothetical protein
MEFLALSSIDFFGGGGGISKEKKDDKKWGSCLYPKVGAYKSCYL